MGSATSADALGPDAVETGARSINEYAARFLTQDVIDGTLGPTVDDVLKDGRFDLISLGFLISLWSGSRALNVFVDTISIMYGQSGVRGIVQTRVLSFSLYVLALVVGIVTIPLVLLGPDPDRRDPAGGLGLADPPVLAAGHPAHGRWADQPLPRLDPTPVALAARRPRRRAHPVIWLLASYVVRGQIAASLGGTSIYGPLSAPIVLLIWLYALAIAVLIGAAFNAAVRELWPHEEQRSLHERFGAWVGERRRTRTERRVRPAGWDDPFDGYGAGTDDDDLGLAGLRDAARGPLTPISGAGRNAAPQAVPGAPRPRPAGGAGRSPGRRGALTLGSHPAGPPVWISSWRSDNVCEHAKGVSSKPRRARM